MPGGADVPQIVDEPVEAGGRIWHMTCVSMGNPHAVIFPDRDAGNGSVAVPLARMDLEKLGPCFENNPRFPDRTNTEFVHVTDRENVEMRVWERGKRRDAGLRHGVLRDRCGLCAERTDGREDTRARSGRYTGDRVGQGTEPGHDDRPRGDGF
jgi:hypothetical protein